MPIVPVNRNKAPPSQPPADDTQTYEVGYRKPPKHSQFKPGLSGNPKGRPKHAKGFNTIVRAAMLQKVRVRSGGKERAISRAEVLVMKTIELASKDNLRAVERLLGWYQEAVPETLVERPQATREELSETDRATLEALREDIKDELSVTAGPIAKGHRHERG